MSTAPTLDLGESRSSQPILTTEVTRLINAIGGHVWLLSQQPDGLLFRAEVDRKQFRLLLPRPGYTQTPEPLVERGSPVHVVTALPALRQWLHSLAHQ